MQLEEAITVARRLIHCALTGEQDMHKSLGEYKAAYDRLAQLHKDIPIIQRSIR